MTDHESNATTECSSSQPTFRTLSVQSFTSNWLFNRLQHPGGLVLIDARSAVDYASSHLLYSINLPPPSSYEPHRNLTRKPSTILSPTTPTPILQLPDSETHDQVDLATIEASISNFADTAVFTRRKLFQVLIYTDESHASICSTHQPVPNQIRLKPKYRSRKRPCFSSTAPPLQLSPWLTTLTSLLIQEGLVTCVSLLEESYGTFAKNYPFMLVISPSLLPHRPKNLTGPGKRSAADRSTAYAMEELRNEEENEEEDALEHRTNSGNHRVMYPNEIVASFLYMGNMWQATQAQMMIDLGITHIINASLDCDNAFPSAPLSIHYLNVRLKDKETEDISVFFNTSYEFIEHARAENPKARLLVHCTQGVSRSAALVVFYLMKSQRQSLVSAYNFLLSRRQVVFPNYGFTRQLMAAERALFNSSSVREEDMDALLNGRLIDAPVSPHRTICGCTIL